MHLFPNKNMELANKVEGKNGIHTAKSLAVENGHINIADML